MKYILICFMAVLLLAASPTLSTAGTAVAEMANIVIHLNHYPAAAEKQALAKIIAAAQTSAGEKTLAGALMRMQHKVGGEDAGKLRTLVADSKAAAGERTLAGILLGITHHPSGDDMQRLKALQTH
ncbi:MAG: hypothetical protein R8K53_06090 [Mariprofundaceae bacterium]